MQGVKWSKQGVKKGFILTQSESRWNVEVLMMVIIALIMIIKVVKTKWLKMYSYFEQGKKTHPTITFKKSTSSPLFGASVSTFFKVSVFLSTSRRYK